MRSSILLSAFALGVLAEPVPRGLKPADSASCWTRSSCEPGPKTLSTTYSTTLQLTTSTKTITAASTATPSPQTTIITGTTTVTVTAPTSTKVVTSTQTSTSTVLVTTTSSLTAMTTTTVTSTTTSVIPIATPFVPVRDQIPGSNYQTAAAKRDAEKRSPAGAASKSYYPAGVNCIVYSKSTISATKTVTSIATASAATVSSSTVTTVTSTVYPSATSTVTAQTTAYTTSTQTTSTTVTTSTVTSTMYEAASAPPIVAACDLNRNFINSVGNENIIQIYQESKNLTYITSNQNSAYDCCVYAYNNPHGNPSTFVYFPSPRGKFNCVATSTDTCTTGQLSSVEGFETGRSDFNPVSKSQVIGQFQCGRWHYRDAAFIAAEQASRGF